MHTCMLCAPVCFYLCMPVFRAYVWLPGGKGDGLCHPKICIYRYYIMEDLKLTSASEPDRILPFGSVL